MSILSFLKRRYSQSERDVGRYLTQPTSSDDYTSAYQVSRILRLVSLLVVGVLTWCYFADLPEVTSAEGEIVPQGRLLRVKHLEGGTVRDIYVRNGDIVSGGDLLLELDDSILKSELRSLETAKISMLLTIERLRALLEKRAVDFSPWEEKYPLLVETQLEHYDQQSRNYQFRKDSISKQMKNRRVELASKKDQVKAAEDELNILQQQHDMNRKLLDRGLVSRVNALDTEPLIASSRNRLAETQNEMESIRHSLEDLKSRSFEIVSNWREQLNSEKSSTATELAVINEQISEIEARITNMRIYTPVTGIVKGLTINSNRTVIAPGELMMEIIPTEDTLLVEAQILPEDIGHVKVGLHADIKVTSYEHQKFGTIAGFVAAISPSTYLDTDNSPYYLAEINLSQRFVGNNPELNHIYPGMTVKADIITNRKTIMEYLLKPLQRGFEGAFSER